MRKQYGDISEILFLELNIFTIRRSYIGNLKIVKINWVKINSTQKCYLMVDCGII